MILATIGLGIGANTAIFTVVNSVLLQPLPYPEPSELVMIWEQGPGEGWERVPASAEDFLVWQAESATMEAISGGVPSSFSLTGEGSPERVPGFRVAAGFFDVFGVSPALGVPFGASANVAEQDRKVVLSDGLWNRRFGGDPTIIGRTVQIEGAPMRWSPSCLPVSSSPARPRCGRRWSSPEAQLQDRNWHFLLTVGRLAPGVSIDEGGPSCVRSRRGWPRSSPNPTPTSASRCCRCTWR